LTTISIAGRMPAIETSEVDCEEKQRL